MSITTYNYIAGEDIKIGDLAEIREDGLLYCMKKSKLEEAREYYRRVYDDESKYDLIECMRRLRNKYEEAIEEIKNEK